jgi:hypothetical protein
MPLFIETLGLASVAIAVCDRCKMKKPFVALGKDPNFEGLRVCQDGCADQRDPYRLPARQTERINLRFPRPDLPLTGYSSAYSTYGGYVNGNTLVDPEHGD